MQYPKKPVVPPAFAASLVLILLLLSLHAGESAAQQAPQGSTPQRESAASAPAPAPPAAEPEQSFEIVEFLVSGNTLFSTERLTDLLDDLVGPGRSAADVEKARDTLEKFHHEAGYPTVVVNIPEQNVEDGVIHLQVVESRIGATRLTGNRYFSSEQIMGQLPSLAPGAILYVPDVQREVGRVNRIADFKVTPAIDPGKEAGTVDVALKAEDHLPLHGSLELNDRNSLNTTALRLNAALHYDNLWNREHSLSLQYQNSPEKPSEVEVFSGSYTLPAPWNRENSLTLYGVDSDSQTGFGEGFQTVGKGTIIGVRYSVPLPGLESFSQTAVLGFDYKNFQETTGVAGSTAGQITTPVQYFPFNFSYSGTLSDQSGQTVLNAALNIAFRGMVTDQQQFANKRFDARGDYLYATLGAERRQKLPGGAGLLLKLDGLIADQPLISSEQFTAGGMESVRGYHEAEAAGDGGVHGVTELAAPDLAPRCKLGERFQIVPYLFYDFAFLFVKDPLPGQQQELHLQGSGAGVRGILFRDLEFQFDWAVALSGGVGSAKAGDNRAYFKLKYQF